MIKPLFNRIVAEKLEKKTKTASGLYLTTKIEDEPTTAIALEIGPDVKHVKKGDQIVYREYSATTTNLKVGDREYLIIKEEDVLGLVKGDK